jgi:elongation factor G
MAGFVGLNEGLKKGACRLLEPIMRLEVIIPEEFLGEVLADLSSRRTKINSINQRLKTKIIDGDVPLSEMFGYATAIRSLTQGRGTFTMEPSYYGEVPDNIAKKITGKAV